MSALALAWVAPACSAKPVTKRPQQDLHAQRATSPAASASASAPLPLAALAQVKCSKLVRSQTTEIPPAPFASRDALMAWTGAGLLVWSSEGDRAAVYALDTQRWTALDSKLQGMRIHGVAGPTLLVARDGQYPKPLEGLSIDSHNQATRPFQAPTKVLLQPLTVGETFLFSTSSQAPISSDETVVFDPRHDTWSPVRGPLPQDFAHRRERADTLGDDFLFRWGGTSEGQAWADGSLIDAQAAARLTIPSQGAPSPRARALAAAHDRSVAVWGGVATIDGQRVDLDDGAIYALDTQTWRPIPALADAPWTTQRGVVLSDQALVAWGDRNNMQLLARFDLARESWALAELPAPAGSAVQPVDAGLIAFISLDRYGILDPITLRWCEEPLPGDLGTRGGRRSAWTGEALVAWGGTKAGRSGGCETFTGPGGCDPYVEHIPAADGWLISLRRR